MWLQGAVVLALLPASRGAKVTVTGVSGSDLTCAECSLMQEAIQRTISQNISALEKRAVAGSQMTATVQIGQLIWHVCESDAWREQRYRTSLDATCSAVVMAHVDTMTESWKDKSSEAYKEPAMALRMKRAVCTNAALGPACSPEELPSDYEPLRADECAVCRALVGDLFHVVHFSRERPTSAKNDNFFRLHALMAHACAELQMRHAIRPSEVGRVAEMCEDLWDEHEATLTKLALKRSVEYAQSVCTKRLQVCDEDAPPLTGPSQLVHTDKIKEEVFGKEEL